MTAFAPPLPYPGEPSPSLDTATPLRHQDGRDEPSQQQRAGQSSWDFDSRTTAPLRDNEPPASHQMRQPNSEASVLDRGRPKAAKQRTSSLAGLEQDGMNGAVQETSAAAGRAGQGAVGIAGVASRKNNGDGEQGAAVRRGGAVAGQPNSFFGVEPLSVATVDGAVPSSTTDIPPATARPARAEFHPERRSSFYGLDAHVHADSGSSREYSPTPSTQSQRQLPIDKRHRIGGGGSSGSGSGSYSSHEVPHRPRYSHAPITSSRSASLYGFSSSTSNDPSPPPPAQLLDQSHLQPGNMASLLSHDKTLELYRLNAKKTNDPDIQYEFCTFVMDVVADLEHSTVMEKMAAGKAIDGSDRLAPLQQEIEAKHKQQALVAESIALLNRLATRGHVKSSYFLAECYTQGIGTQKGKRDYDKAFPLFLTAGKHGHAAGSYRAAQCLEFGWGTRKDLSKAVSFYRRAAVLSHVGAMHRLGLAELNGELGLTKRPKDGVQWLTRAAELADQVDPPQPQSLHELAILHEKGMENVVFQDEEYAAELLARAAELQYAPSAYRLGECYEYGKMGCPQDAALSIHYYNIAAQQNHPAACFALTAWYLVGSPGVLPQSDTEAYLWAKKAAEAGLAKAEYACGYFTEIGIGTCKDQREALEWFRKAALHGDKRAQDRFRMAGRPVPEVVKPPKRTSPGPGETGAAYSASSFPLPGKQSRLSAVRMLKKEPSNMSLNGGKSKKPSRPRTTSANARSMSGPAGVDRKGKGREKTLPDVPAMPPMHRQRSYSQPSAVRPEVAPPPIPLDYNLRPVQHDGDFAPLAYDHREAQHQRSQTVGFGGNGRGFPEFAFPPPQQGRPFAPLQPDQVRLPTPQNAKGGLTMPASEDVKHEREKVLQRRKNAGEDKDCAIM
ncbi:Chitin synthase 4 [Rhodotorula toruloides]